jgi:hypothetical protein
MKSFVFLAAFVSLAAPALGGPQPDPIAPAATGNLQCYVPDRSNKTCNSLAGYKRKPDGTIDNTALVLVSKSPVITMETVSPVEVKSGQVCGTIRSHDIDEAKFASGTLTLDAKQTEQLRQQMKVAFKDMFNHEICTRYIPDGDALLAKATMDGVPMKGEEQRVIWVSPRDGYRVGP